MRLTVRVDGMREVQARLRRVSSDLQPKALQPALNKVADKARAEINRAIPEEYAVKAGEVRNAINLRRAQGGNLEAIIEVFGSTRKRGRSMNMIHFLAAVHAAGRAFKTRGAKATKKDLAALDQQLGFIIKKAGGLKKLDGAFLGNKGRTVFRRVGKGRLPIEPVQVIGFSQMFRTRRIESRVMNKINKELPIEVGRAVRMLLERSR